LRYQIWSNQFEKYDRWSLFDLNKKVVVLPSDRSRGIVVPTFPVAAIPVLTAAEAGYPANDRSLIDADLNDLAPRVGFAWRPFGKSDLVLRGGYGIYYYNAATASLGPNPSGAVFSGTQTATQQLGPNGTLDPIIAFPNPFTAFGPVGTLDPATLSFTAVAPNLKNPFVQEYSLSLERSWKDWGTRFSYFGHLQTQTLHRVNLNEPTPSNLPFSQNRRPIPLVRDIIFTENGGYTRNNGLQIEVRRPFARGLSVNAAYTWMKAITDITNNFGGDAPLLPIVGTGGNFNRRERFKGNTRYTPRQQFIVNYTWDVPVGRGRPFLSSLPTIVEGILGGGDWLE
jgi:hypothetical protein